MVLLCTISVATYFQKVNLPAHDNSQPQAPQINISHLECFISNKPIRLNSVNQPDSANGDVFSLKVQDRDGGGGYASPCYSSQKEADKDHYVYITQHEWDTLEEGLAPLSGWKPTKCNTEEPEARVVYTCLKLSTDKGQFVFNWRGSTLEQKLVMEALLASPFGPSLRKGMARISAAQAESR
jgi:hypothetical protein